VVQKSIVLTYIRNNYNYTDYIFINFYNL
jgi:hypothetical protein